MLLSQPFAIIWYVFIKIAVTINSELDPTMFILDINNASNWQIIDKRYTIVYVINFAANDSMCV